jgi:hypothetical protein
MPSQPRKTNVEAPVSVPGMQIRNIEFKPIEDEQEKTLRLHKERVGFYVKEIGTWLLGFFFVIAIGFFCFWVLVRNESASVEKDWARSGLTAILGGIVGFLFGKVVK